MLQMCLNKDNRDMSGEKMALGLLIRCAVALNSHRNTSLLKDSFSEGKSQVGRRPALCVQRAITGGEGERLFLFALIVMGRHYFNKHGVDGQIEKLVFSLQRNLVNS
jgi:hypothetical protein